MKVSRYSDDSKPRLNHSGGYGYYYPMKPGLLPPTSVNDLLPEDQRVMPVSTYNHRYIQPHELMCRCEACRSYPPELKRELRLKYVRSEKVRHHTY